MDQFRKSENPVRNTAASKSSGAPWPPGRRAGDRSALQRGASRPPGRPITVKGQDGTVTFDGWWVDIDRRGGMAAISAKVNRYSSKRIPLSHIEQVVWKRPSALVNGYLEFVVHGEDRPADSLGAASASPNAVLVTKQQAARFEPLYSALLDALARNHATAGEPARVSPRPDIAAPQMTSAGRSRSAGETAGRHLPKVAWVGLVLGTFFAAAAAVDTEIAVFVAAAVLAVVCGGFLISRDREQDRSRFRAGGAPAMPQSRRSQSGRTGES